jgi:hypothetical protein
MLLTEKKLRRIIRRVLMNEEVDMTGAIPTFSTLPGYKKGQPLNVYNHFFDPNIGPNLRDEFFRPINYSYMKSLGQPNADIQEPDHLAQSDRNDYTGFFAWDVDEDPWPDVIRGMKPKSGYQKLSLSATDGTKKAAAFSKADTVSRLKDGKHFAEMSGAAASVAFKAGVPAVKDPARVKQLIKKDFIWFGKHPSVYDGSDSEKMMIANLIRKNKNSPIEVAKTEKYGPEGQYDAWYVRMLGAGDQRSFHAKICLGEV